MQGAMASVLSGTHFFRLIPLMYSTPAPYLKCVPKKDVERLRSFKYNVKKERNVHERSEKLAD